eukprot:gene3802-5198_t
MIVLQYYCFIVLLFAALVVALKAASKNPLSVVSARASNQLFQQQSFKSILIRGGGPLYSFPLPVDLEFLSAGLSSRPIISDTLLTTVILSETVFWLKIWTTLAKRNILPSTITRKIIHSGSAPLFILHWPLYSAAPSAKLLAATI